MPDHFPIYFLFRFLLKNERAIVIIFSFCHVVAPAQPNFKLSDTLKVKDGTQFLKNPWTGGINYAQFSYVDMNLDGIKDIFIFDRSGNKILTFINGGTPDSIDYLYAPGYEIKFPPLHDWALLADYNCDGKEDIFSYSNAGFCVWKNRSDVTNGLQFERDEANMKFNNFWRVYSNYGSTLANLYISSVDIPAIVDVDNDGDLDVLTYSLGGSMVEYHQNQSMDLYGNCDSLKFVLVTSCWGNFYENALDNSLSYPVTCKGGAALPPPFTVSEAEPFDYSLNSVHTGSTILAFDNDCDGDKELLIGDISFANMVLAVNGGSASSATINAQDFNFPSYNTPVNLRLFPAGYFLDVNNDSLKDLVLCPNAKNVSENYTSVWYYENIQSNCSPVFQFKKNNLFQDEMIDFGEGSYPLFFDFNADGLTDILIGNFGYYSLTGNYLSRLAALENKGTASMPQFELVDTDYASLSALSLTNIFPTSGDLDGDGDKDLLTGVRDGYLVYFENTAGAGNPANFQFVQSNYQGIDVGLFAAPQLVDLDKDGKPDLVIGEQSGNLNYYHNTGTLSSPVFTLITDSFGKVKTSTPFSFFGYSAPFFYIVNNSYRLICGTDNGYLYYYDNIDGNLTGTFSLITTALSSIYQGQRSALSISDINNDGMEDLVVGNYRGGISIYIGDTMVATETLKAKIHPILTLAPNPAHSFLRISVSGKSPSTIEAILIYNVLGITLSEYGKEDFLLTRNGVDLMLDEPRLPPGIYIIKIKAGWGEEVTRLAIMNHNR